MYPPTQQVAEIVWMEKPYGDEEFEQQLIYISQYRGLEDQIEDNSLDQFISAATSVDFPHSFLNLIISSQRNSKNILIH